jgi:hypothetical protein
MRRLFLNILNKRAVTIGGWTPGLRGIVGGRVLPCGCLAGIYETWAGGRLAILDGRDPACPRAEHVDNLVLWRQPHLTGGIVVAECDS